jgi:hypothetical protein
MVFWIVAALCLLGIGWMLWGVWFDDWFYSFLGKFFGSLGILLVGGGLGLLLTGVVSTGLAYAFTPDWKTGETTSTNLRAVTAKDVTEGRFAGSVFASYGYIDGKRVVSYVTQNAEGGIRLGYVDADNTVLYEKDDVTPNIQTHHFYKENLWFFPTVFTTSETYSIYVPSGTVVDGFEIKP